MSTCYLDHQLCPHQLFAQSTSVENSIRVTSPDIRLFSIGHPSPVAHHKEHDAKIYLISKWGKGLAHAVSAVLPTGCEPWDPGCSHNVKWKCVCLRSIAKWINPIIHSFVAAVPRKQHSKWCCISSPLMGSPVWHLSLCPCIFTWDICSLGYACCLLRQRILMICHQTVPAVLPHPAESDIAVIARSSLYLA